MGRVARGVMRQRAVPVVHARDAREGAVARWEARWRGRAALVVARMTPRVKVRVSTSFLESASARAGPVSEEVAAVARVRRSGQSSGL